MIADHYLDWAATAPAPMRAEATGALARSYLFGGLEPDIRDEVEAALAGALDDPSLLVRRVLAEAFASSPDAPAAIVLSLAQDAPDVAEPVLSRSPLLGDFELVDLVAVGGPRAQIAVAGRAAVSAPLSAAIAEVACAEACEALVRNSGARLWASAAARIAARHGHDGGVRDALFSRCDVGPEIRQILMRSVADALAAFVSDCGWLKPDRARRAADEACERGALSIAAGASDAEGFVRHLVDAGQFPPSLTLRALLSGDLALFEAALSALSGQSPRRVAGFVRDFEGRGFAALCAKAGFQDQALKAFRAALLAAREVGFVETPAGEAALSRRMVERTLTACDAASPEVAPLRALLRRFAAEAARDDARRSQAAVAVRAAQEQQAGRTPPESPAIEPAPVSAAPLVALSLEDLQPRDDDLHGAAELHALIEELFAEDLLAEDLPAPMRRPEAPMIEIEIARAA